MLLWTRSSRKLLGISKLQRKISILGSAYWITSRYTLFHDTILNLYCCAKLWYVATQKLNRYHQFLPGNLFWFDKRIHIHKICDVFVMSANYKEMRWKKFIWIAPSEMKTIYVWITDTLCPNTKIKRRSQIFNASLKRFRLS